MIKKTIPLTGILLSSFMASCSEEPQKPSSRAPSAPPPGKIEEKDGMVLLRGGTYLRGNNTPPGNGDHYPEEGPAHKVEVSSFWIDKYEVTNAQFKEFVDATGYVTFAEKSLSKDVFPKAPPGQLVPGATVFAPPPKNLDPREKNDPWDWWSYRKGACWKRPNGEGSSIKNRMDHPVVCVNVDDAKAYAKWAGKRLPTEAEWELAARGGTEGDMFTWGNEARPEGKWLANCFQGNFPAQNTAQDGYLYTAPVGSFPPNAYGLYDMAGNVWEICSDYFHPAYYRDFLENPHPNPTGPESAITQIELEEFRLSGTCPAPQAGVNELMFLNVTKGGSFLCHFDYCLRYRPAARHHAESLSPSNHSGFRCVKDAE